MSDLVERRWIGVVPTGLGGPARVTRLERVGEIWRDQGMAVTEWVPLAALEAAQARIEAVRRETVEANKRAELMHRRAQEEEALRLSIADHLKAWVDHYAKYGRRDRWVLRHISRVVRNRGEFRKAVADFKRARALTEAKEDRT